MTTYDLWLESGPMHRKTLVHVPSLLGCVAVGPTTDDALTATPVAIRAFRGFLASHGEASDSSPVETAVAGHITEGEWLGNGSSSLTLPTDLEPVSGPDLETFIHRHRAFREALAAWSETQTAKALDAAPAGGGRTARGILLHALEPAAGYLSSALGSGIPGFGAVVSAAGRGELTIHEAYRKSAELVEARLRATTAEERAAVVERSGKTRTLAKSIRRLLEHDWEHLAELSRRPGGPKLG